MPLILTVFTDALYGLLILLGLSVAGGLALLLITQWVLWREKVAERKRVQDWCPLCELNIEGDHAHA